MCGSFGAACVKSTYGLVLRIVGSPMTVQEGCFEACTPARCPQIHIQRPQHSCMPMRGKAWVDLKLLVSVPWFLARPATWAHIPNFNLYPYPLLWAEGFQARSVTRLEPTWTVRLPARPTDSTPMPGYNAVRCMGDTMPMAHTISNEYYYCPSSRTSFEAFVYYSLHLHG